jgi:hypothetical protein
MVGAITGGKEKHAKDLMTGYHSRGACVEKDKEPCLIAETFGNVAKPGILLRSSFIAHALRGQAVNAIINGGGGYGMFRITHIAPRSREEQVPYMPIELERIAFVDGCWKMQVRPWVPEERAKIILGMIIKAVEYLHDHRSDYKFQMGGRRNSGAGIVECEILNPLYDLAMDNNTVARRVFKGAVETDEEEELSEEEQVKKDALLNSKDEDLGVSKRKEKATGTLSKKMEAWDSEWAPIRDELVRAFEAHVEKSRERFAIAKWQPKAK